MAPPQRVVLWFIYGDLHQSRPAVRRELAVHLRQHEFHPHRRRRVAAVWTRHLSGTNLIFNGIGGSPRQQLRGSGKHQPDHPLTNWLALTTNTFDGTGQFRVYQQRQPAKPWQFFIFSCLKERTIRK